MTFQTDELPSKLSYAWKYNMINSCFWNAQLIFTLLFNKNVFSQRFGKNGYYLLYHKKLNEERMEQAKFAINLFYVPYKPIFLKFVSVNYFYYY